MVKRYDCFDDGMNESNFGDYVRFDDYAALEAKLEHVTKKLNLAIAERDFWREADANSQKQLFECKQSLEATPPASRVTEEMVEAGSKAVAARWGRTTIWEEDVAIARAILTAAQEAGKP